MATIAESLTPESGQNTALKPLTEADRIFGFRDHTALWLSMGVGLLVMQIGAYLVPALGAKEALVVIVLGSVLGAGLLAWTAKIACDSGLSSAGLMMLSSIFVPLYGVILARLAGHPAVASLVTERTVNYSAVVIWLSGIACYHLWAQLLPGWGAALPTLALTFALARLTRPNAPLLTARA